MNKKNNRKLKVALFVDSFFPMVDGVVIAVDNYARYLSKSSDVTVFTLHTRKPFDDSILPYRVVRCPSFPLFWLDYDMPLPKLSYSFHNEIEKGDFDVFHIHSPFGVGKMAVKIANKHNIPVVATMHSQFYKDFMRSTHNNESLSHMLLKEVMKVFDKCDETWAVNGNVANIFFNDYKAKKMPLVQKNGTDIKKIEDLSFIPSLKEEYGICDDEKILLFVGRLTLLKNIDFLIRSLKILKDKNFKFKMLFVGSGEDEHFIKKLTEELGLKENVLFLGKIFDRHDLAKVFALGDLFLFPSLYDCNSLVQIEAASQETPTVFIENSATSDSVVDNFNGYIAKGNEIDYANKIIEIFQDEEQYKKVCQNAYDELYISWSDAVKKAKSDYIRLINEKRALKHQLEKEKDNK